jgi:hypothetical protein
MLVVDQVINAVIPSNIAHLALGLYLSSAPMVWKTNIDNLVINKT